MSQQPIGVMGWESFDMVRFHLGLLQGKACFNGFGEFSFWWIQFALVLQCNRSNFSMLFTYFGVSYNIEKLNLWHLQYFL